MKFLSKEFRDSYEWDIFVVICVASDYKENRKAC